MGIAQELSELRMPQQWADLIESSSTTVGAAVDGGTANAVLFTDANGNLGTSSNFVWDSAEERLGVGIDPSLVSGKLVGYDDTDIPLIAGNSTGTQDILQCFDNATAVFRIADGGHVGISRDGAVPSANAAIYQSENFTDTANFNIGLQTSGNMTVGGSLGVFGYNAAAISSHTSGFVILLAGFYGGAIVNSNGQVLQAHGLNSSAAVTATLTPTVSELVGLKTIAEARDATVTLAVSVWGQAPTVDTGSIGVSYAGLFEDDVCVTTGSKLLLEGTSAAKGDTYFTYDSSGTTLDCFVNGTEVFNASSTRLSMAGKLNLGTPSTLTISSGAITVTKGFHYVDTESGASTDDLTTINGGVIGDILILGAASSARTIVLKDNTGNLRLSGDFSLDNVEDTIMLIFAGTNWLQVAETNSGA